MSRSFAVPGPRPHLGVFRSGYYTQLGQSSNTNNASGVGSLRLMQVPIPTPITITRIGAEITAAGEAGSKLRLGIYTDDNGMPSALVLDAGTINGDSATVQELTVNVSLNPGLYWFGGAVQVVTTTQPTYRSVNSPLLPLQVTSTSIPAANAQVTGANIGSVTGALPATVSPSVLNSGSAPRIFIKVA